MRTMFRDMVGNPIEEVDYPGSIPNGTRVYLSKMQKDFLVDRTVLAVGNGKVCNNVFLLMSPESCGKV